ncbi:MAG TPA: hypothetical protein VII58_11305 [Acidobacteriaceae bacterium]
MPTSTITVNGNPVTLVPLPATPAPRMVEPWAQDSVAVVTFPFTGQTQAQSSSGADLWGMMVTYAPLTAAESPALLAWLLGMRGMFNAVQMAPPEYQGPQGSPAGVPVLSGAHVAAATSLVTSGWAPNVYGQLLPWDCIQLGYRLHRVLDPVNSDAAGHATFRVWPSVREDQASGAPVVIANPLGLFRLASNKRSWSADYTRLAHLSFPLVEYR